MELQIQQETQRKGSLRARSQPIVMKRKRQRQRQMERRKQRQTQRQEKNAKTNIIIHLLGQCGVKSSVISKGEGGGSEKR